MLDSFFGLKEQRTTVHGELLAGLITFLTMAYIIVVQPHVLSQTGMDLSDDDRHAARLLDRGRAGSGIGQVSDRQALEQQGPRGELADVPAGAAGDRLFRVGASSGLATPRRPGPGCGRLFFEIPLVTFSHLF